MNKIPLSVVALAAVAAPVNAAETTAAEQARQAAYDELTAMISAATITVKTYDPAVQTIYLADLSELQAQLNKELVIDGQQRFTGMTAAQASPQSVKDFTETKLASFIASVGNDNLIISYKNVNVRANNSDYYITYDFIPNVPVNKTFFTGNILDFSVEV